MTYKKPRLKHVNNIKKVCYEMEKNNPFPEDNEFRTEILKQCNLLLETKKKNKCKLCKCKPCSRCDYKFCSTHKVRHSPQPEIEKLDDDLNYSAFRNSKIMSHNTPYVLNQHAKKINLLIDQINKLTKTKND